MTKEKLKKYVDELSTNTLEYYKERIIHEFAFNYFDSEIIKSEIIAKQFLTEKIDSILLKGKSNINILGFSTSKNFVERILKNLPVYERKEPLIIEIANVISYELQKLELLKQEYLSINNINTSNSKNLTRLEKLYGVNLDYDLGVKLRQNILIARDLARISNFNMKFIKNILDLFMIKAEDIVNDKSRKTIQILTKDKNDKNINVLYEFLQEIIPAFYQVEIIKI